MMTELLTFVGCHWAISFLLGTCVVLPITCVALAIAFGILNNVLLILPNRIMRHFNIHKHGWPPAHCDGDGDAKIEETT